MKRDELAQELNTSKDGIDNALSRLFRKLKDESFTVIVRLGVRWNRGKGKSNPALVFWDIRNNILKNMKEIISLLLNQTRIYYGVVVQLVCVIACLGDLRYLLYVIVLL